MYRSTSLRRLCTPSAGRGASGQRRFRSRRAPRPALAGLLALALACMASVSIAVPQAGAVVVRSSDGHLLGVLYRKTVEAARSSRATHARGETSEPLSYRGSEAPVMLKTTVYPIFWAPAGHEFPAGYEATIEQYLESIAASSRAGLVATNDWSIPTQYTQEVGGKTEHISETFDFGEALHDTNAYPGSPGSNCPGDTKTERPCISDAQVQEQVKKVVKERGWPMNSPGHPEDQYLVFFPPEVEGCSEPEGKGCTYSSEGGFCGYHSSFEAEREAWLVYSNIPSLAGCASGQAPEGVDAPNSEAERKEVDGTLDTLNHELAESATDPMIENKVAWMNPKGNEVGDLCTEPVVKVEDPESGYGLPLGGSFEAFTAYNELISGKQYYVQALWSNAPTKTPAVTGNPPAGCLQRLGPTPQFKAPEHLQAQLAATFNAEGSYDVQDPITTYEWSFGDGTPPVKSTAPTISHVFKSEGTYEVSLTVSDERGASLASTERLKVTAGAAEKGEPIAEFTFPTAITAGEEAEFSAAATKDAKNVVDRYEWSFGDGSAPVVSESATVKHAFAKGGEYTVALTVTDMSGKSDRIEKRVKVAEKATPTPAPPTTATVATHTTTSTAAPPARRRRLRLAARALVHGRDALLRLSCPAAAKCGGQLVLLVPARLLDRGRGAKRRGLVRVAAARYTVGAGRTLSLRILLAPKLARLLGRGRPVALTIRVFETGAKPFATKVTLLKGKVAKHRALRRRRARRRR